MAEQLWLAAKAELAELLIDRAFVAHLDDGDGGKRVQRDERPHLYAAWEILIAPNQLA